MHLIYVASKCYTLVKEGALINEANIPVQELDSQRGKGAYFGGHIVYMYVKYSIRIKEASAD